MLYRCSPSREGRTPLDVEVCMLHHASIVVQKRVGYVLSRRMSTFAVRYRSAIDESIKLNSFKSAGVRSSTSVVERCGMHV